MKVRPGFVVSSATHAALLAWGLLGLSSAKPFDVGPTEALPIEILTPEQFDAMTKGSKVSKKVDAPKVKAEKIAQVDPEPKDDNLPVQKEDVDPTPPAPAPEPAKSEPPKAETPPPPLPTPAPPKVEPKLEPVKAETKPAPPPTPVPTPEPAPKQAEKKPEPPKPEPSKEQPKPEPPKPEPVKEQPKKPEPPKSEPVKEQPKPEKPKDQPKVDTAKADKPKPDAVKKPPAEPSETKFDASKISALLNKKSPGRTEVASRETATETTAGTSRGTASKLSVSQRTGIDNAVREQVMQCWNPPVGAASDGSLAVRVSFTLNADGTLSSQPQVTNSSSNPAFRAASGAATRAVQRCAPLKLPAEAFDYWQSISINFDPKDMMGG